AYGQRTALVARNRRWSYAEVDAKADRLATGLQLLGLKGGDRVVIQLPNVPEFVVLCFALFRLGGLPVLALPAHRRSEITYLCDQSEATAYVIPDVFQGFSYGALAEEVLRSAPTLKHVLVVGDPGNFVGLQDVDAEPHGISSPN